MCGGWSQEGLLALGSEDKSLSINNAEGDTLRIINLRAEPSHIQFSEMKLDERLGGENTVRFMVLHLNYCIQCFLILNFLLMVLNPTANMFSHF